VKDENRTKTEALGKGIIVTSPQYPLRLWGGVECTINRVGDVFFDQHARSGHRERVDKDIELFAGLGLRALRTALQWEYFEMRGGWVFADNALKAMDRFGLHPILGLLHHGSGPPSTGLLDPLFPNKFATFAVEAARRYPWVLDYTPINEPQSTARFACLYGHWFPHHRDMRSYVRALYHQIKGIVMAMRGIRVSQPEARLVHTEDAGATFATAQLEPYRVEREHRRWLGLDLLCGRMTRHHPLFRFLMDHGLGEGEILWFADNPCPPSIVGLNYYVTSDRFLDHRLHLYPEYLRGGDSGYEPLVDIEAVRVRPEGIVGAGAALMEAWNRYQLPVAITEAHLGSEPDQQMRWLAEAWSGAQQACDSGVDVRAVTVWGLLGLHDWSNLCTRSAGMYEPGVFDLSSGTPTATLLAKLVESLARGEHLDETLLLSPGWWRQSSRFTFPPPIAKHKPQRGA
jgi:dTDP-4-dehydrorhamnose reductase